METKDKTTFKFQLDYPPRDEDDPTYMKSFDLSFPNADQDILQFFQQFGFVVVRDVLTPDQCDQTLSDLFTSLEVNSNHQFNRNDPSTWRSWPSTGLKNHGMPHRSPTFSASALSNRQNPLLFRIFSLLLHSTNLIVNHDRWCFFRPTQNIYSSATNTFTNQPNWSTKANLHMDMNPFAYRDPNTLSAIQTKLSKLSYGTEHLNHFIFENNQICSAMNNGVHLQGVINLHDNKQDDGGFWCVPGFVHHFDEWTEYIKTRPEQQGFVTDAESRNSVSFEAKSVVYGNAVRIAMRKGSVVVWDQRMPHGAKDNKSDNFRAAQFVKMFEKEGLEGERRELRKETMKQIVKRAAREEGFEITELGRKVFDLEGVKGFECGRERGKKEEERRRTRRRRRDEEEERKQWECCS